MTLTAGQLLADAAWGDWIRHARDCPRCGRVGGLCEERIALNQTWLRVRSAAGGPPPQGPPYERHSRKGLADEQLRGDACIHCGADLDDSAVDVPPQRVRWYGAVSFWFPMACPGCRPTPRLVGGFHHHNGGRSMSTALRDLLTQQEFASVRSTVLDDNPDVTEAMAGRIVDEALKFVVACAKSPGVGLAPSRVVDEGWHALLLHSAVYARICTQLGSFVHHYPGYDPRHYDPVIIDRTREKIAEAGYDVDAELWGHPTENVLVSVAANCQHAPSCTIRPMPKPEWP
ncbi:hypothetical protein [Streptomyces chumphonensis]|uniref:hypothetical protein n=1 Tax=Streptomyces chumphonensis TaxID=1214925 RepID=UPI003D739240